MATVRPAGRFGSSQLQMRFVGQALGKGTFVIDGDGAASELGAVRRRTTIDGSTSAFVAVDGRLAGALILHDPIRPDACRTIRALRRSGIDRVDTDPQGQVALPRGVPDPPLNPSNP